MDIANGKKICIYCMGEYGIQTYYKLKESGIRIDCFGDRDINKQGYVLDGLYCKSYEEVVKLDKENTIIIVAIKYPQSLIQIFRNVGFKDVYDKESAMKLLCGNSKIEIEPLNEINEICRLKNFVVSCYYNRVITEDILSTNKCFEDMLKDFLRRNSPKVT